MSVVAPPPKATGFSLHWGRLALLLALAALAISYLARVAALMPISDQSQGLVLAKNVTPFVLGASAASVVISLWLLAGQYSSLLLRPKLHKIAAWLLAVCILSTILGLGIALVPKEREAVENSLLVPPGTIYQRDPIVVSHPIFFKNGSRTLDADQRHVAAQFLAAAASCPKVDLEAFGFASSAAFKEDPNDVRNLQLSLQRADVVVALAHSNHIESAHRHDWANIDEMRKRRGVRDTWEGSRVEIRELLNRRVDMVVHLPGECIDVEYGLSQ